MKRIALLLILSLTLVASSRADENDITKKKPAVTKNGFYPNLDIQSALAKAKKDKKVVLVDFTAKWCGFCRLLDQRTFSQKKVQDWMVKNTIAIKVDVDKVKGVFRKYKIQGVPCLIFLNPDGSEKSRIEGYLPADRFLKMAKRKIQ